MLLAGVLMSIVAIVFWLLPDGPIEPRVPLSVFGPLLFVTGWLSWKYHEPAEKRMLRMAVSIYVFAGVAMTAMGLVQQFGPDPLALPATAATATAPAAADAASAAGDGAPGKPAADKKKTREARVAEMKAERKERLDEQAKRRADEIKTFTTGSYLDAVEWRARSFVEKAAGDFGFAVILVSMFLLGVWFVRSGVMADSAQAPRVLSQARAVRPCPSASAWACSPP